MLGTDILTLFVRPDFGQLLLDFAPAFRPEALFSSVVLFVMSTKFKCIRYGDWAAFPRDVFFKSRLVLRPFWLSRVLILLIIDPPHDAIEVTRTVRS